MLAAGTCPTPHPGVPLEPVGPPVAPWGYTGEWEDPSGLVKCRGGRVSVQDVRALVWSCGSEECVGHRGLRARWYNPAWGRFTQLDPFPGVLSVPATQHPYAYGLNSPVRYVDPTGRVTRVDAGGFGGADILLAALLASAAMGVSASQSTVASLSMELPGLDRLQEPAELVASAGQIARFARGGRRARNVSRGDSSLFSSPGGGKRPNRKRYDAHIERHLIDRAQERWEELFGTSRQEMLDTLSDPYQCANIKRM